MTLGSDIKALRQELREHLMEMYSSGEYTHRDVSAKTGYAYGDCVQFYSRNRRKYCFPEVKMLPEVKKKGTLMRNNCLEAHKLYRSGMSLSEIGKRYGGVTGESVRYRFKKYGLEL